MMKKNDRDVKKGKNAKRWQKKGNKGKTWANRGKKLRKSGKRVEMQKGGCCWQSQIEKQNVYISAGAF